VNIYKLNYTNEETAIIDLISKGVYVEETFRDIISLNYGQGIQAVVDIGQIVKVPATYDDNGNIIIEPIYYDGVFYDVMSVQDIDFGTNEVHPTVFVHTFAGLDE